MGRAKLPRKSTNIDMTAMCDVAFLLLSFFILATKTKPPEAVAVVAPSSVSSEAAPDKSIMITMTKDEKIFVSLGDETKKMEILKDLNDTKGLNLSPAELTKLKKQEFYGMPLNQIKGFLALSTTPAASQMPGIPVKDSLNNELVDWLRSVTNAYKGTNQSALEKMLLVKGDNAAKYPTFKNVKAAFKKNSIYKFSIVTNSEAVPTDSELYIRNRDEKK